MLSLLKKVGNNALLSGVVVLNILGGVVLYEYNKFHTQVTSAIDPNAQAKIISTGDPGHDKLVKTLKEVGVKVVINASEDCRPNTAVAGVYSSGSRELVICQDNRTGYNTVVKWTVNDLDTLRHEAQHVVQDCAHGQLGDLTFLPLVGAEGVEPFARRAGLTQKEIDNVTGTYILSGASDEDVLLEIEAYAVAKSISPTDISTKLISACKAP